MDEIVALSKHLLDYEIAGMKGCVPFSAVMPFISDFKRDEIEYVYCNAVGNRLAFCLNACSGQAGAIGIWDIDSKQLVHLTKGSFAERVTIKDGKVWSLHAVSYWGHPLSFELDSDPMGIVDYNHEPETVKDNLKLEKTEGEVSITVGTDTIVFS